MSDPMSSSGDLILVRTLAEKKDIVRLISFLGLVFAVLCFSSQPASLLSPALQGLSQTTNIWHPRLHCSLKSIRAGVSESEIRRLQNQKNRRISHSNTNSY